jgi:hypothetical protein
MVELRNCSKILSCSLNKGVYQRCGSSSLSSWDSRIRHFFERIMIESYRAIKVESWNYLKSQCREEHDPDSLICHGSTTLNFSIWICRQWCNCEQVHFELLEPVPNKQFRGSGSIWFWAFLIRSSQVRIRILLRKNSKNP